LGKNTCLKLKKVISEAQVKKLSSSSSSSSTSSSYSSTSSTTTPFQIDDVKESIDSEQNGVTVTYTFLNGFEKLVKTHIDLLLLSASSVLCDGRVLSSSGAATAAALAHRAGVQVFVVAESFKFSEKIAIDSLSINAVGNPSLIISNRSKGPIISTQLQGKIKPVDGKDPLAGILIPFEDKGVFNNTPSPIIPSSSSLCVLPLLFDLTCKGHISGYITEQGLVEGQSALFIFFSDLIKTQLEDEQGKEVEEDDEKEEEGDDNEVEEEEEEVEEVDDDEKE
jgi:hypothetical protein